jgi:uncharacterized protein (DUF302 family)
MTDHCVTYGYTRTLPSVGFDDAVQRTTEALKKEGFGVLTTIDVQATLKQKLNADFRRYVILGACHPALAQRALTVELGVGLLLPCNVVVFQADDGHTVVQMVKPAAMLQVVGKPELEPIATEADQRMSRALAAL